MAIQALVVITEAESVVQAKVAKSGRSYFQQPCGLQIVGFHRRPVDESIWHDNLNSPPVKPGTYEVKAEALRREGFGFRFNLTPEHLVPVKTGAFGTQVVTAKTA